MTIQELRFFSIYLSKINPNNVDSRCVEFKLDDFKKIMDLGRINKKHIKEVFSRLMCKQVEIPISTEKRIGFSMVNLFNKCQCVYDEDEQDTIIIIDAHEDMLPLLFDLKQNYLKYELWNCLSLKSTNQIRLYELLKQYEALGVRIVEIDELKAMMGLAKNKYERYVDFKKYVVDVCKKALKENTDIYFEYEPIKKGRRFTSIKFIIYKNKDYKDQICLKDFVSEEIIEVHSDTPTFNEMELFLIDATAGEFNTIEEMKLIFNRVSTLNLPKNQYGIENAMFDYVKMKYREFKHRQKESGDKINNPFLYFLGML